jgi:hypothetical protein
MQYQITSSGMPTSSFSFPFNTDNYANYTTHSLTASNTGVEGGCTSSVNIQVAVCDVARTSAYRSSVKLAPEPYNVSLWFVTGSQNATGNMNLTVTNTTTGIPSYNGLLSAATDVQFTGSLGHNFTISVRDTQIPLTCTYTFPSSAGTCNVIPQSSLFYRQARWSLGEYLGTQGPTILYGTPNVYNYGLARFFNGVDPDNLPYRIRVYTRDGSENIFQGNEVFNTVISPGSSGTTQFLPLPYQGINLLQFEWRYTTTSPTQPPFNLPLITGNVALAKISYTPQYLAAVPNAVNTEGTQIPDYQVEDLFISITANEIIPICTPFVPLRPPLLPEPPPFDGIEICCFTGDTLVTLADLTTKRIDQVRVGDRVLSYNEITNQEEISIVVGTTSPTKNNIVKFTLSNGTVVEATTEHPLWEVYKGWCSYSPPATFRDHKMKVAKIEEGDTLRTQQGEHVTIDIMELDVNRKYEQVYNIKLEGHHTYYANGIVVHNEKPEYLNVTCTYESDYPFDPENNNPSNPFP